MSNFETHPLYPGDAIPFFISGGALKYPAQSEPFLHIDPQLVPLLTFGGFTMPEWLGNAKPGQTDFVYYPDRKMAGNARGLPNPGKEGIIALKGPIQQLSELGIKTLIQIASLPHEDPLVVLPELAEIAADSGPTGIEVSLSCPSGKLKGGGFHKQLSRDADLSGEIVSKVRDKIGYSICMGIKDSAHTKSLDIEPDKKSIQRLSRCVGSMIDFVTGINSIQDQPFPEITCTDGRGGMSGPVIAPTAKSHLRIWQEHAPDIPYLSCGGVDSENADTEISERLDIGALRVGGTQEFFRIDRQPMLAIRWSQAYL